MVGFYTRLLFPAHDDPVLWHQKSCIHLRGLIPEANPAQYRLPCIFKNIYERVIELTSLPPKAIQENPPLEEKKSS